MFSTRLPVSFILRHTLTLRPSLRRAVMTAPSLTPGSAAAIQMASPAVAAAAPGASIPPRWAAVTRPEELDALSEEEVRARYRPFVLGAAREGDGAAEGEGGGEDWVGGLELDLVRALAGAREGPRMRVAVLYGSLRSRSFSRLTAYEAARVLARIGADVRVFDPAGLPLKDDASEQHPKVQELRALSQWSEAQLWCSPEQHGTITAVMKNQVDWIPLSVGSVRPTQGRTLAVCQVNGGSQSFNTVNLLRQLGRWMRMWTIPNQSSIPTAWKAFSPADRLLPSSNRDRLVDVCEELVKATVLLLPHRAALDDRFSEREERRAHGRLRTQAEAEAAKAASKAEGERVREAAGRGSEVA